MPWTKKMSETKYNTCKFCYSSWKLLKCYLTFLYNISVKNNVSSVETIGFNLTLEVSLRENCPNMEFFSGPYFPIFSPNVGKYRPEKPPYLGTFHAVYWPGSSWYSAFVFLTNEDPKLWKGAVYKMNGMKLLTL